MRNNLGSILKWLYPNANPLRDWEVYQEGENEPYIRVWNIPGIKKPTEEEVMSHEQEYIEATTTQQSLLQKVQAEIKVTSDPLALALTNYLGIEKEE